MTQAPSRRPDPGLLGRAGLRRILLTLCLTVTTSYGVLYYAFPVMATHIAATTGWSTVAMTGGFSGAQLVSALVGIPVGRHLDRHGPRVAMTAGSALAALATVAIALAPTLPMFIVAWLLAGVAAAAGARGAGSPDRIARSLPFAGITIALSLASFAAFAALMNLVPLLQERGLDTSTAALALGLGGAGQVAGRLTYPLLSRRLGVRTRTVLIPGDRRVHRRTARPADVPNRVDQRFDRRRHGPRPGHTGTGNRRQRPLGNSRLRTAHRPAIRPDHREHRNSAVGRNLHRRPNERLRPRVRSTCCHRDSRCGLRPRPLTSPSDG